MGVAVACTYPLLFKGVRDGYFDIAKVSPANQEKQRTPATIAMVALTVLAGIKITDLGFVVAFGGAILGSAIIYVIPSQIALSACKKGKLALHLALCNTKTPPDLAVAKVLLDAGASADGRNGEDMTALFVVSSMCPDREAFYQEEYAKRRVLGATKALLAAGADVNAVSTAEQLTALHAAAAKGHAKLVALLIKRGANVEAEDKAGVTPLVLAVHERCEKCVLALIEGGAKVDEARRLPNPSKDSISVKIAGHLANADAIRAKAAEAAKAKAEAKAEL